MEVAEYILQGFKYKKIGEELNIAEKTVGKHASNLFGKVNLSNKKEFIEKYSEIFPTNLHLTKSEENTDKTF